MYFLVKIRASTNKHTTASKRDAPRLHERGRLANEAHQLEKDEKHGKHNRRSRKGSGGRVEAESLNENGSERRANNVANAGSTRVKLNDERKSVRCP